MADVPIPMHHRARVDLKSATLPPEAFAQLASAIIRKVLPLLRCTRPAFVQQVVHGISSLCLIEVFLRYHLLTFTTYSCIRGTIMSNSRYFYGHSCLSGISAASIWPLIVLIAAERNNRTLWRLISSITLRLPVSNRKARLCWHRKCRTTPQTSPLVPHKVLRTGFRQPTSLERPPTTNAWL
jgi:hypothetical protein